MSTVVRMMGWGWLLAGLLAIVSAAMSHMGGGLPLPPDLAETLSLPWSKLGPLMGFNHPLMLALMAAGVFVNAQILFVIANILGD